jgi:hypothetical protein
VTGPPGPLPISLALYDITWPLHHQHQTPEHALTLPHVTIASTLATMPSLLLVVFTLQFVLHLINTVGASTIDELVCTLSGSRLHCGMLIAPSCGFCTINYPHQHLEVRKDVRSSERRLCS